MTYPLIDGAAGGGFTQTTEAALPEGLLRIETVVQEITWEDAADEGWKFTDAYGHEHAYAKTPPHMPIRDDTKRGRKRARKRRAAGKRPRTRPTHYPTLFLVITARHRCYGDEGLYNHDPHWVETTHYECRICGLTIEPGHGPGSKLVPVSRTATLTEEMTDPPPGWLDGHDARVTWRKLGQVATRVRVLSQEETAVLVDAEGRRQAEQAQADTARSVATGLGYPAPFGWPE
jgi:hypothetical protein